MKFSNALRAVAFVAVALFSAYGAEAQVVTQLPYFAPPRAIIDLGNGPTEIQALQGSGGVFTSQGSGIGSGTTTSITLTATPAVPPCVGCSISGGTLTTSSHVTAYNGTTGITTDTSQTVAASTPLSWGAACPVSTQQTPVAPPANSLIYFFQPAVPTTGAIPFYTEARMCMYGGIGPGFQFITFPIAAH